MKPTTAANVSRANDRPDRQRDDQQREAGVEHVESCVACPRGARRARDHLRRARAGQQHQQPHATSLRPATTPSDLRQQAEHHQPQAEVVGLGQRVQPRERVRKAQQAQRPGEEEDRAGDDGDDATRRPAGRSSAFRPRRSSDAPRRRTPSRTRWTRTPPAARASAPRRRSASTPVAAPSSSSAAMPPVPSSCAAIMRSASSGPRRMRASPSATIASTNDGRAQQELSHGAAPPRARARAGVSSCHSCSTTGCEVSRQWYTSAVLVAATGPRPASGW